LLSLEDISRRAHIRWTLDRWPCVEYRVDLIQLSVIADIG
jgi:hypothetical protein